MLRLLTRTTRSVAPMGAGERLLHTIGPRFEEIEAELAVLSELREKPAGTIRITATEYAADAILLPKCAELLPDYPDIKVEIVIDYGLTDIVAERLMPACAVVNRWRKTWSPCASGRTCVSRSWGLRHTSRPGRNPTSRDQGPALLSTEASGRCRFTHATLAGARGNGRDAPTLQSFAIIRTRAKC
jgi:DNA-binding transcriptional LysR family regulator